MTGPRPSPVVPASVAAAAKQRRRGPLAKRLDRRGWCIVAGLIAAPVLIMLYKHSGLPGSQELRSLLSFGSLPAPTLHRTLHLLFAPVGALVVVFTRLTLGIRVLGPFRSVLLALAFQVTGVGVGLVFFALVLVVVLALRPVYRRMRIPYFGRSAAMLASVAAMIVLTMLAGLALGISGVERVVYFPVVVLTLTGEAFASAIRKEGLRCALWRASATVVAALVIAAIASVEAAQRALTDYPETVLLVLAGVILICECLAVRVFERMNPPPAKKKKKAGRKPPA